MHSLRVILHSHSLWLALPKKTIHIQHNYPFTQVSLLILVSFSLLPLAHLHDFTSFLLAELLAFYITDTK